MKAISAAAALLAARVLGTDVSRRTEIVEPVSVVMPVHPRCAVDSRNGQVVSDCCVVLSAEDFYCGSGYIQITTFSDIECEARTSTACYRLGLRDGGRCGHAEFPEEIPTTCPDVKETLKDFYNVEGIPDNTCHAAPASPASITYACVEKSGPAVPTPSPFIGTWSPTRVPTYESGSGEGPTPSPFFVDTWAPTRFPTLEEGGSGFGPTVAVSAPPTLAPTMTPTGAGPTLVPSRPGTPAPTLGATVETTDRPTKQPTLAGAIWQGHSGESEDDSGSFMLVASMKVVAGLLTILIFLQ